MTYYFKIPRLQHTISFLLFILILASFQVQCQNGKSPQNSFTAVFYNVENLYDTLDDPRTNDDEFTPGGRIPWTTERYTAKLQNLSKVIASVLSPSMPDLVGLSEVENREVLEDLLKRKEMKNADYAIIHFNSPDERGSDVALIYRKSSFQVAQSIAIPVDLHGDKTRDILFVQGKTPDGSLLNIFINHWPSRREGAEISEPRRIAAAQTLRKKVDSLFLLNRNAKILIMGDFNDNPVNTSISQTLGALDPVVQPLAGKLYNLLSPRHQSGKGSLFYKSWDLFDQVIVSGSLMIPGKGLDCKPENAAIFDAEWLMFKTSGGDLRPNRTMGSKYYGGYSDHLPVYVTFN